MAEPIRLPKPPQPPAQSEVDRFLQAIVSDCEVYSQLADVGEEQYWPEITLLVNGVQIAGVIVPERDYRKQLLVPEDLDGVFENSLSSQVNMDYPEFLHLRVTRFEGQFAWWRIRIRQISGFALGDSKRSPLQVMRRDEK